mgnify:CR=1 FL=1
MILSNPSVVFKFDSESKKFASSGEGLKSAVFAVYGDGVLKNTVEVSLDELHLHFARVYIYIDHIERHRYMRKVSHYTLVFRCVIDCRNKYVADRKQYMY